MPCRAVWRAGSASDRRNRSRSRSGCLLAWGDEAVKLGRAVAALAAGALGGDEEVGTFLELPIEIRTVKVGGRQVESRSKLLISSGLCTVQPAATQVEVGSKRGRNRRSHVTVHVTAPHWTRGAVVQLLAFAPLNDGRAT